LNADQPASRALAAIGAARLIAIVRSAEPGHAYPAATRLIASGARVIEISLTTPDAWEALERLAEDAKDSQVQVGAGTVLTRKQAQRAARLGAHFLLSPVLDMSVMTTAAQLELLAIPGCTTPTEMHQAVKAGAAAVKIFPARLWTPGILRDLLQAMPGLRCVPTGGIEPADGREWLAAGAFALGMGSALTALTPSAQARAIGGMRAAPGPVKRPACSWG
jgi:2-dehydro-3-deoxyphosphogluconate aldolase / (4S)-4-hydroxy-2-oxoglutarate aldolase